MGAFKFNDKKIEKREISRLENRILTFKDPTLISNATSEWEDIALSALSDYKQKVQNYLDKRFPRKGKKGDKLQYQEDEQYAQKGCPIPPTVNSVFK